ncbi:GDSL-type esterase/lipase family protein [Nocardia sp. CA-135398]|uniref:GDSL-type esterase/lipase family protein n=1 Tax=Nocardia sp. CA-135398 TaxID=3239977 RepID=UPI003D991B3B
MALGSSYASGPGLPDIVDTSCSRSAHNYPHQVATATGLDLVDVSCGGATTANILDTPQHTPDGAVVPVQIDAVTDDTRLVTITIGGNDLNLVGSMTGASVCAEYLGVLPGVCETVTGTKQSTQADFDTVERSITTVGERRARESTTGDRTADPVSARPGG